MAYGNFNQNNGGTGYQKKNNYQSDNVTTAGVTFINEAAGRFMNFNYWGRNVSLEIAVCPGGKMDWEARKAAQTFKQVISFTSISDLASICDEVYDSIKTNGGFNSVGIRVGSKKDSILEISNGENLKLPMGIYLVIYKGLDNTNRTNIIEYYPFDNTHYIRGYNHDTGAMKEDISKLGEFRKFRRAVNAAADAFTMAQAHTISELKKGDKMTTFKALSAISAALGVDLSRDLMEKKTSGTSSYSKPQGGSGNNFQRKPYGGNYQKSTYSASRRQGDAPGGQTFENPNMESYQRALNSFADQPVDINLDMSQLQGVSLSDFSVGG